MRDETSDCRGVGKAGDAGNDTNVSYDAGLHVHLASFIPCRTTYYGGVGNVALQDRLSLPVLFSFDG
jgi:hypothetical protein